MKPLRILGLGFLGSLLIITGNVIATVLTPYSGADETQPINCPEGYIESDGECILGVTTQDNTLKEHEQRIGGLEVKTDDLSQQIQDVSTEVTIIDNRLTLVEDEVDTISKKPVTQPTPKPTVEEPQPIDPHIIVSIIDIPKAHMHVCKYTLQNGKTKNVNTGDQLPCYEVGTILPQWLWPR